MVYRGDVPDLLLILAEAQNTENKALSIIIIRVSARRRRQRQGVCVKLGSSTCSQ